MTLASKSFRTEPQHFIAEGDHVVLLTRTTADGHLVVVAPSIR